MTPNNPVQFGSCVYDTLQINKAIFNLIIQVHSRVPVHSLHDVWACVWACNITSGGLGVAFFKLIAGQIYIYSR